MSHVPILETLQPVDFSYPEDPSCIYRLPAGLKISRGEAWCIYGVSGSGKSTLLTLLAALRRFREGRMRYAFSGGSVLPVTPETWDQIVGPGLWRRIGFSFQRPELLRALTVRDNLTLVLGEDFLPGDGLFEPDEWRRIRGQRVWKISGGQIQRLGLMRAFGQGQDLVFLDEPTNNLDRRNRDMVAAFVLTQRASRALIVVSHDDAFLRQLEIDRTFEVRERRGPGAPLVRSLEEIP